MRRIVSAGGFMTMSQTMFKKLDLVPRLSIVIPAPANTAALEETLVSVLENRPDDCEIVVALGCEYSDPWNIRDEVRFVQAPAGSSMTGCINLGIASSHGEWIHILAAGWQATAGWTDAPLLHFATDPMIGAIIPLGVCADDSERILSAGIRYSRGGRRIELTKTTPARLTRTSLPAPWSTPTPTTPLRSHAATAPIMEVGFWRAAALERAGPEFSTVCGDRYADADMAVGLSRGGFAVVVEPASRVVAKPSQPKRNAAFASGLHAERLFWRSLAGSSIVWSLVLHVLEVVRHAVAHAPLGTLPMLAGRAVALLQFGAYLPRARQLQALMQLATPDRADGLGNGTIRFDNPHATAGQPKRMVAESHEPLRRSA